MTTMATINNTNISARRMLRHGKSSANVRSRGGDLCLSSGIRTVLLDAARAGDSAISRADSLRGFNPVP